MFVIANSLVCFTSFVVVVYYTGENTIRAVNFQSTRSYNTLFRFWALSSVNFQN